MKVKIFNKQKGPATIKNGKDSIVIKGRSLSDEIDINEELFDSLVKNANFSIMRDPKTVKKDKSTKLVPPSVDKKVKTEVKETKVKEKVEDSGKKDDKPEKDK